MKFYAMLGENEAVITNYDLAKALVEFCQESTINPVPLNPVIVAKLILLNESSNENAE